MNDAAAVFVDSDLFESVKYLEVDEVDLLGRCLLDQLLDHMIAVVAHHQHADLAFYFFKNRLQQLRLVVNLLKKFLQYSGG